LDSSVLAESDRATPSRLALFLTFVQIGLCGFGGVGPWARRILVEDRGWVTEREYAEILGLCQVLPGPNVGNVSVAVGDRFHGPLGSILALVGLLCGPVSILLGLAVLYDWYGDIRAVKAAIGGVAAAAAGLFLGTGLRMGQRLRLNRVGLVLGACAFVGIGILRLPLFTVVLLLAPLSVVLAWRSQR
jgi:chromate transporter